MSGTDEQTSVQNIRMVAQLLDDSCRATCDDDTCLDQLFESSCAVQYTKDPTLQCPFEALGTHISGWYKKFWTDLQAFVEEPHDVFFSDPHCFVVCGGNDHWCTEAKLLWLCFVAVFLFGYAAVQCIGPFAVLHVHKYRHIGIFVCGGKVNGFSAGHTREPDGRRLLNRARPDVDVTVTIMLALKGEGTRTRPCLDDQIVCFFHTFAADGRVNIIAKVLHAGAAYKAGDDATTADHIQHGNLLGNTQGIVVQWERVANNSNLCAFDALRQDRGHDIWRGHGTISILVILVNHDAIPAQSVCTLDLVEVTLVKFVALDGIIERVGQCHPG